MELRLWHILPVLYVAAALPSVLNIVFSTASIATATCTDAQNFLVGSMVASVVTLFAFGGGIGGAVVLGWAIVGRSVDCETPVVARSVTLLFLTFSVYCITICCGVCVYVHAYRRKAEADEIIV